MPRTARSSTASGSGTARAFGAGRCERLASELDAWHGQPVFAYGFEDLTARRVGAARGARRPRRGRGVAAVRAGTRRVRLAAAHRRGPRRAAGRLGRGAAAALGGVRASRARPPRARAVRRVAAAAAGARRRRRASSRGQACAARSSSSPTSCSGCSAPGRRPERVALVVPSVERWRGRSRRCSPASGSRMPSTPVRGSMRRRSAMRSLAAPLRLADRRAAAAVRVSSLALLGARAAVRRLRRGQAPRARSAHARARRGGDGAPARGAGARARRAAHGGDARRGRAVAAARWCVGVRCRGAAGGRDVAPRPARVRRGDRAARRARVARALGVELGADDVIAALERTEVRGESSGEVGRVAVLDLLRARTPRFEVVFVLGLEEGSLPRRSRPSPFLDDDVRAELGARLERPDQVSRDRYLFYTACTRAIRRLYLVREAVTDEGATREPSPFWEEVASVFDAEDVAHATIRRAARCAHLAARGGTQRTRAAARARCALGGRRRRGARARGGERVAAPARPGACGVGARDADSQPRAARMARLARHVRGHRARALRGLLFGMAARARDRAEDDRRRGRRDAARAGGAPDPVQVLRGTAARARRRRA